MSNKVSPLLAIPACALFLSIPAAMATTHADVTRLESKLAQVEASAKKLRMELDSEKQRGLASTAYICQGRLTTESGVPISTTDRVAQSTLYFTPYQGSRVAVYTGAGSAWTVHPLTEISLALSGLAAGSNYDVFIYNNAGTLTLELSAAWTTNTARADGIGLQNGVLVLSADETRRYLGTIRATSATTTEDSSLARLVWNYYNRVPRYMVVTETTDSWAYAAGLRQTNANTANQVDWVLGQNEILARAFSAHLSLGDATARVNDGTTIGASNTAATTSQLKGFEAHDSILQQVISQYDAYTGNGYEFLSWNERGTTGNTFYGDNGGDDRIRPGMIAIIEN